MILLAGLDFSGSVPEENTRFGLLTDIHFARRKVNGTRYFDQSITKLTEAIQVYNREHMDFLIELGDLKDQGIDPVKTETLSFLDEIESTLKKYKGPLYHVLGNHDMDSISKKDFLQHTRNHGKARNKTYYSFIRNHLKFIVLDANYNEDGSDYDSGKFNWTKAFIPAEQKDWLQKELSGHTYPVIIFLHQLLDSFSGINKNVCVGNAGEIVDILEQSKKVIAVFQGHHHAGHHSFRNGIHYYTMKGMIEGSLPDNNSFAIVEVDKGLNIHIRGFYNCKDQKMDYANNK